LQRTYLLISADESLSLFVKESLEPSGYIQDWKKGLPAGLRNLSLGTKPIVLDLLVPDSLEALLEIKAYHPEAKVISDGDLRKGEEALRAGAYFIILERRIDREVLKEVLRRACSEISLKEELEYLKGIFTEDTIVARSAAMKRAVKALEEAERADGAPVLITGEPGSGRELMARRVHARSPRAEMPFVSVKAEDGAGGLLKAFHAARGGSLFIKELQVLEADLAGRVLGFISEGTLRLDGLEPVRADLRIMAGAAAPVSFDAVPVLHIPVPPLKERREDIIPLAQCFLEDLSKFLKTPKKFLTRTAKEALLTKEYKRNAAELKSLVQRAYFMSKGPAISDRDLMGSEYFHQCTFKNFLEEKLRGYLRKMAGIERSGLYHAVIGEVEKALIELSLRETGGNKLRAAKALGMNRNTFRSKIKQFRIKDKFN
jgi:DNA-binding NtrC family response regulator